MVFYNDQLNLIAISVLILKNKVTEFVLKNKRNPLCFQYLFLFPE